eukprot:203957-Prorocentrum_minimum.AAC.5
MQLQARGAKASRKWSSWCFIPRYEKQAAYRAIAVPTSVLGEPSGSVYRLSLHAPVFGCACSVILFWVLAPLPRHEQ